MAQVRQEIRNMLNRIILAGGKRKTSKKYGMGAYELEGDGRKKRMTKPKSKKEMGGLRAYGLKAGKKMTMNPWIKHVKAYAKAHGMSYNEALQSPNIKKGYKKVSSVKSKRKTMRKKKAY